MVGQVVVPGRDARVDDRDADAGAGQPEIVLHGARADGDGGAVVVRLIGRSYCSWKTVGMRRQLPQQTVRQVEHLTVDQVERVAVPTRRM